MKRIGVVLVLALLLLIGGGAAKASIFTSFANIVKAIRSARSTGMPPREHAN